MRLLLLAPLLLAACERKAPAPPAKQRAGPVTTRAAPVADPGPTQGEDAAGDAAATLRTYYARIEAGDYGAAWGLRTADAGLTRERFAANFAAYESYRAVVGAPSLPVAAGDWDYVEVPVMITGRLRGGRPFGSSGSVTLRRPHAGGAWRIYTG